MAEWVTGEDCWCASGMLELNTLILYAFDVDLECCSKKLQLKTEMILSFLNNFFG